MGMKQRLGIASTLLRDPELIILDEPANGLDPAGIVEIRELLLSLSREKGVTIFMSSHILAEVARLAGRIGIIHQGRLLQELDFSELENKRRRRTILRARDTAAAYAALAAAGRTAEIGSDGAIELKDAASLEHPEDIATLLVQAGTPPIQLLVEEEDLEQYFLRLVGAAGEKE
jgi:ABC-2 type transport system ATP-binding protein